ncbi:MAG: hypothetical protein PSN04_05145 [Methyloprofundus sp.]|nr:hypothetical protein [Methyloprofundus sp.]
MNSKSLSLIPIILVSLLSVGCSSPQIKESPEVIVKVNDYPTRDRVEFVFNCIAKHGGKNDYVSQYACGCKIDKIAEKLSFAEFEAATTFSLLRSTPGENGAAFRDPQHAKTLRKRLKEADAYAENLCFVN